MIRKEANLQLNNIDLGYGYDYLRLKIWHIKKYLHICNDENRPKKLLDNSFIFSSLCKLYHRKER